MWQGCETGRYGDDCTNTCDHCKNPATCGIEQGECDDLGCAVSSFQPPLCVGNENALIKFRSCY